VAVQLALADVDVCATTALGTHGGRDVTVGELRDRGIVHLEPSPSTLDRSRARVAPILLSYGHWDPPISPEVVTAPTRASGWTWQAFELCHAQFMAAHLAALRTAKELGLLTTGDEPVTLAHVLRGAQPATADVLRERVVLAKVDASGPVMETSQCLTSGDREHRVATKDLEHVRKTATNTPLVDSYVTLEREGGGRVTVFFQLKHSRPGAQGKVSEAEMEAERRKLDEKLRASGWTWGEGDVVVLVYVTNRPVVRPVVPAKRTGDTAPTEPGSSADTALSSTAVRLLFISRDELPTHMGFLAHRGLLASDT